MDNTGQKGDGLNKNTYAFGLCIGIISGILWGGNNFLFARGYELLPITELSNTLDDFSLAIYVPVVCAAINDVCAAVALLIFNGARGVLSVVKRHLFTRPGLFVCLAALLGGPVGQSSYFLGIAFAGAPAALIITATYPIIGCILSYFFLHQPITSKMWAGIIVSVVGAILVGYTPVESQYAFFTLGLFCSFTAALCWGSEVVLSYCGMTDMNPDVAITLRECISGGGTYVCGCRCGRALDREANDGNPVWRLFLERSWRHRRFFLFPVVCGE